jgi:CspA family cold shock protein
MYELTGRIKWFDPARAYGFMVADESESDVFLPIAIFRDSGYETAPEGARLHCQVERLPVGWLARSILSMDTSIARTLSNAMAPSAASSSEWQIGTVKWFNRIRGFGFIAPHDGGTDIFVHIEVVRRASFIGLRPFQCVRLREENGIKGRMAAELAPLQ